MPHLCFDSFISPVKSDVCHLCVGCEQSLYHISGVLLCSSDRNKRDVGRAVDE